MFKFRTTVSNIDIGI